MDHSAPSTTPTLLKAWPIFLAWLPMGSLFYADSAYFGYGMILVLLIWACSLPVFGVLAGIATLVEVTRVRNRLRAAWWRPLAWAVMSALYWLIFTGYIPLLSIVRN
ncbi:hypothetical protein [Roseimicrobium sp. ORNL1]|uniref:hypothetical protein n=1 Tax=Roseimicrobium sp. ORNL1 TaxID=2711231 RepID=UPI0013E1B4B6|nr:hypothetical protein [Roseimicrobium sp. ORNL1]QIF03026.1 hypothetical protein G5S37_16355 [Roseimicrobium sp. ORNL1]